MVSASLAERLPKKCPSTDQCSTYEQITRPFRKLEVHLKNF